MRITWEMVGGMGRPIQETQNAHLGQVKSNWGTPQEFPQLPQGPQPTPFVITNTGNGSR